MDDPFPPMNLFSGFFRVGREDENRREDGGAGGDTSPVTSETYLTSVTYFTSRTYFTSPAHLLAGAQSGWGIFVHPQAHRMPLPSALEIRH